MKIIADNKNDLLSRREIKIIIESGKNPTFDEASEIVAKEFKAEKDNIIIDNIKGKFGRKTFLISGKIYNSKEDKEKIEPKKKEKKKKAAEEKEEKKEAREKETPTEQAQPKQSAEQKEENKE